MKAREAPPRRRPGGPWGGRFGGTVRWRERLFAGAHLDLLGDLTPARPVFNNVSPWTAFPLEGSLGVDVGVHFP